MRQRTQPVFFLIDSFAAFITSMDKNQAGFLSVAMSQCEGMNLYFVIACSADDGDRIADAMAAKDEKEQDILRDIRQKFSRILKERLTLLFGGRFDKQELVHLSYELSSITTPCKTENLNNGLICDHGRVERIFFPIGDLKNTDDEEDDEKPVF